MRDAAKQCADDKEPLLNSRLKSFFVVSTAVLKYWALGRRKMFKRVKLATQIRNPKPDNKPSVPDSLACIGSR